MSKPLASDHANPIVEVENLNMFYGETQALHHIDLSIPEREVTAFIGPSGCGKSTLLRCLNRLNDLVESARIEGSVRVSGRDIYAPDCDVIDLRRRVGMVFQKSNPFPKSIYENVAYGLRIAGENHRWVLDEAVEKSLKAAALWDEVKDRLKDNALGLSGGQQQRLCIARALAVEPEVVLMDEPCSALDPIATARVEETISELKARLAKTLAFVQGFKPSTIDGSEERDVTIPISGKPTTFKGQEYLVTNVLPNFYFHATAAYTILRHCGVTIGKRDFLGRT